LIDSERARLAIHLSHHYHSISEGVDQTAIVIMHDCVVKEVQRTPNATNLIIVMAASKTFMSAYLIRPDETNFKDFMADSAGANWHTVCRVYGSGDKDMAMVNKERTCLFHWTKCLHQATLRSILLGFQEQHIALCKKWKNAKTQKEAEARYTVIRAWWVSFGATTETGRCALEDWMAFWHFRYCQWGKAMQLVSFVFATLNWDSLYLKYFYFYFTVVCCTLTKSHSRRESQYVIMQSC
jgi:hypothetical protein